MVPRLKNGHYSRNYKIALICSLLITLAFFYLSPRLTPDKKVYTASEVLFHLNNTPPTIQNTQENLVSAEIPAQPGIEISGKIADPYTIDEVLLNSTAQNVNSEQSRGKLSAGLNEINAASLPFIPRQTKEVMPQKINRGITGYIKLSLMIGVDGKVEKYLLVKNTTGSIECLKNVIAAVYKSRWQPAQINGNNVEYWIEKVYNFQ